MFKFQTATLLPNGFSLGETALKWVSGFKIYAHSTWCQFSPCTIQEEGARKMHCFELLISYLDIVEVVVAIHPTKVRKQNDCVYIQTCKLYGTHVQSPVLESGQRWECAAAIMLDSPYFTASSKPYSIRNNKRCMI